MQLKPILLDMRLDTYEHNIEFNLAASTGPCWTLNEILSLASEEERQRFLNHNLVYSRPAGAEGLRAAIADMQGVNVDTVQVVTGASEALLVLMWLAAEPGANVIIPQPGFTTFSALPESLRLETRCYAVRKENDFRVDLDEIKQLADRNTKLILVNSPTIPLAPPSVMRNWTACTSSRHRVEFNLSAMRSTTLSITDRRRNRLPVCPMPPSSMISRRLFLCPESGPGG